MKKIVASVGLVALGASSLQSAPIPGLTEEGGKNWSAALTLRGFYDDNLNTTPSSQGKQDTFGIEVSPSINYGLRGPQTQLTLGYVYSFKYYDHRPLGNAENKYDQQHLFNVALDHSFSERYRLDVRDSLAIGQEPDVLRAQNTFTTFQRISGDNIRNYGSIAFDADLTRLFGLEIGYDNAFYDYTQSGADFDPNTGIVVPSNSGLLDRIENGIHLDTRWMILPETVAIFGYKFRDVSYTADELIGFVLVNGVPLPIKSDQRDFQEHSIYIGAEHTFSPNLTGAVRAGASYVDYYNEIAGTKNDWGPYAMANLRYTYAPQSYIEAGLSQDFNATDIVGLRNNTQDTTSTSFTASQEATVLYANINHQITPQLRGSLLGQFQYSTFNGGGLSSQSERYYLLGVNLSYQITPHFSTEVGYNYDKLDSDIDGRTFDRNRVYIGVTGSY